MKSSTACAATAAFVAVALLAGKLDSTAVAIDDSAAASDLTIIASEYGAYRKLTPQEVFVNPELALLCVGASKAQLDRAQKNHGPHAHAAVTIYMNDPAADAFEAARMPYPVGAVVVKQKSMLPARDATGRALPRATHGVGGMVKRAAGYDPEHGDWEYFYFESPDEIEHGRIASCVQCHVGAQASDHVFGSWVK